MSYEYSFQKMRKPILERDGCKCKLCGKPSKDVHHIDGNRANNKTENLMVLCESCNNINRKAPILTINRLIGLGNQRRRFGSKKPTTTKEGKREYMKAYMRWYRSFHEAKRSQISCKSL
jgi:5-methylcytosine-specific restriction endonuclease McrA